MCNFLAELMFRLETESPAGNPGDFYYRESLSIGLDLQEIGAFGPFSLQMELVRIFFFLNNHRILA